jgi:hypothetical protein
VKAFSVRSSALGRWGHGFLLGFSTPALFVPRLASTPRRIPETNPQVHWDEPTGPLCGRGICEKDLSGLKVSDMPRFQATVA